MSKIFQADVIFPVSSEPIPHGVVMVNDDESIQGIYLPDDPIVKDKPVKKLKGFITPGFVNTHTHLELAHLHAKIPPKNGLITFIKQVMASRTYPKEQIIEAMQEADRQMWENGIVVAGDIVNTSDSKTVKLNSPLYYHTFIELMGFNPDQATAIFERGLRLKKEFHPLKASISPHAPYSVSNKLFELIQEYALSHPDMLLTIHNQESEEENQLYRDKTGSFISFYEDLSINANDFTPTGKSSIQSLLPVLKTKNLLLVHNTYTSMDDIKYAGHFHEGIFWCLCPNANHYIENRLPPVDRFIHARMSDYITLGTDSLASNDSLCLLSELKILHTYFPSLPFSQTIRWATLNGARFLHIDDRFGSIAPGKRPGLNLITQTEGWNITPQSEVKKLI